MLCARSLHNYALLTELMTSGIIEVSGSECCQIFQMDLAKLNMSVSSLMCGWYKECVVKLKTKGELNMKFEEDLECMQNLLVNAALPAWLQGAAERDQAGIKEALKVRKQKGVAFKNLLPSAVKEAKAALSHFVTKHAVPRCRR